MKVKELYEKYKYYRIILYGQNSYHDLKGCIKIMTPFSFIKTTNPKEVDKLDVIDIVVKDEEIETIDYTASLKYKGKTQYKGTVYALVGKKNEA